MFAKRRHWFAVSFISLALAGCDATPLTAPRIQDRSVASPQTTVNAPSNLSAAAASQTRINLAWLDNSTNETGFEIRRSTTGPDGSFIVLATIGPNATSYADTGLTPATQYCYKVRAVSVGKKATTYSTLTAPACVTTPAPPVPPGPPQAPENVTASPDGSHGVVVSWSDQANNEDGYRLERSTDGGATWTTAATTAANITSVADWDAGPEAEACYRVSAFNRDGVSALSSTTCATPLAGPTDLTIDSLGNLTWSDHSAIEDGYEVWIMDAFGLAYDGLVATLPPNSTSFQTGGCALWCHGFAVAAIKDGSYSDWASVWLPPGAPRNLRATAISPSEIDLAWTDQPNAGELPADQFDVERCTGDASACRDAAFQIVSFVGATTFRDLEVLAATTYTYRVRAFINVLQSDLSNVATATAP